MAIVRTMSVTVAGQAVTYDAKTETFNFAGPVKAIGKEDARDFCKMFYAHTGKPRGRKAGAQVAKRKNG